MKNVLPLIRRLQAFADRIWFSPFIALLAALDNIVVFIPTDGILISSSMLKSRRWLIYATFVAAGSTLGAMALAYLVEDHGLPALLQHYPGLNETETWKTVEHYFREYGLLCLFLVSVTPLMQQPAVLIASLAATPYYKLAVVIFAGRFLKYLLLSYLGSHTPKLLAKLWGVQGELDEVGIKV